MNRTDYTADVVVVGGGSGGLTAAAFAARTGKSVLVFEKSAHPGGRATTHREGGFAWNLGPHALYCNGAGVKVLRELGVAFPGAKPSQKGGFAIRNGHKHTLPVGFVSLLTTGPFRLPAKLEAARLLGTLQEMDTTALVGVSLDDWLRNVVRHPGTRELFASLVRLATYTNAPDLMSAGAAVEQVQLALAGNVYYLDDGWQVLVDGLSRAAHKAGAEVITGAQVKALGHNGTVRGLRLANGRFVSAKAAILATGPGTASALVDHGRHTALRKWADEMTSVRAACLDIALSRLPRPHATFALGIDCPLYLSAHSSTARLAPAGGATIHVAKYPRPGTDVDPRANERELEALMDMVQPGWRKVLVRKRFLPSMSEPRASSRQP